MNQSLQSSVQAAPLIGRGSELDTVLGLLADPAVRLVSLTGRTGVGKTRLALEVAWSLASTRAGAVHIVPLASVRGPDLVLTEIAAQLEVPMLPGTSVVAAVTGWLRRAPAVLMLDNFEHLLGGADVLGDLLETCPALQLIVTSQAPLRLRAERVVRIEPLPVPGTGVTSLDGLAAQPAVALYCDRAAAVHDGFRLDASNAPDVAELCRELEGLPLAIELAAARARSFPAREILTRLPGQRLDVLRAARRDVQERHHDLRSAIAWTYGLLAQAESELLRGLSVAAGAFDVEDAEALFAGEPADVLDVLSSLVDLNLLTPVAHDGRARFQLPPPIRDFAREQLELSGDPVATEQRWIAWLAARARAAAIGLDGPGPDTWWSWLEGAHDVLRGALQVCIETASVAWR